MIASNHLEDAMNAVIPVVYEEDREMLAKHLMDVVDGKEKIHNLHYRWIDKAGLPVWINCRGFVVDDAEGKPGYLIGCLNETGNQRRADNVTGLLGGTSSAHIFIPGKNQFLPDLSCILELMILNQSSVLTEKITVIIY